MPVLSLRAGFWVLKQNSPWAMLNVKWMRVRKAPNGRCLIWLAKRLAVEQGAKQF